jgi:hypothetical protein
VINRQVGSFMRGRQSPVRLGDLFARSELLGRLLSLTTRGDVFRGNLAVPRKADSAHADLQAHGYSMVAQGQRTFAMARLNTCFDNAKRWSE